MKIIALIFFLLMRIKSFSTTFKFESALERAESYLVSLGELSTCVCSITCSISARRWEGDLLDARLKTRHR